MSRLRSSAIVLAVLAAAEHDVLAQDIVDKFGPHIADSMVLPQGGQSTVLGQARGDYPEMQRPSLPLGQIQNAWNDAVPAPGQAQPGVLRVAWRPDRVIQVRTRDFMVTLIHLSPWETVRDFYLGDETTFEVGFHAGRPNVLRLRQKHPGADSNLAVITESGRLVSFYIRSEGWNSHDVSDLAVLVETPPPPGIPASAGRGALPADAAAAVAAAVAAQAAPAVAAQALAVSTDTAAPIPAKPAGEDYLRRIDFDLASLRWTDFEIEVPTADDAAIAPERVFHDGLFTFFDFGQRADSMERPVVHLVVDGIDSPVNTRTGGRHGSILIAEAVGDFTLRAGPRVVCVRYRPSGAAMAKR